MHVFSAAYFFCYVIMVISGSPIPNHAKANLGSLSYTLSEAPSPVLEGSATTQGSTSAAHPTPAPDSEAAAHPIKVLPHEPLPAAPHDAGFHPF
ncbi:hypothetical protein C8R45DRAFT_1218405 [Mycena sanguinolenta]|nr:hypothetical protein C8R45DRAFT_1218405 [Mycena sanguinolenta]